METVDITINGKMCFYLEMVFGKQICTKHSLIKEQGNQGLGRFFSLCKSLFRKTNSHELSLNKLCNIYVLT